MNSFELFLLFWFSSVLANLRLWGTVMWCYKLELRRLAVIDLKTSSFSDWPNKGILFLLPVVRAPIPVIKMRVLLLCFCWSEYQKTRNCFLKLKTVSFQLSQVFFLCRLGCFKIYWFEYEFLTEDELSFHSDKYLGVCIWGLGDSCHPFCGVLAEWPLYHGALCWEAPAAWFWLWFVSYFFLPPGIIGSLFIAKSTTLYHLDMISQEKRNSRIWLIWTFSN